MTRPPSYSAGRGVLIRARDRDPARWPMFVRGSRPVAGGEPGPGRPGRCAGRGQVRISRSAWTASEVATVLCPLPRSRQRVGMPFEPGIRPPASAASMRRRTVCS